MGQVKIYKIYIKQTYIKYKQNIYKTSKYRTKKRHKTIKTVITLLRNIFKLHIILKVIIPTN